jgi:nucleotide-binding universal stress UspA family protein
MNKILLAYDDTRSGQVALRRAAEMTDALGAELIVITVAPTLPTAGRWSGRHDPVDSLNRRERVLLEARASLAERDIEARYVLSSGRPADTIVWAAREYGADVIIVGRPTSGVVRRALTEDVSGSVRHKASCAVLVASDSQPMRKLSVGRFGRPENRTERMPERLAA